MRNSWLFIVIFFLSVPFNLASAAVLPVFPGAEGFGTQTRAGRGGEIVKVTNLKDEGRGSLREAIEAKHPRIVVFEVSGTIKLKSDLCILDPFITIAGQSAPSPGITLRGAGLKILTHDVLVQHLRIRVGDAPDGPPPQNRDALQILGPKAFNVVIDHISASWAIDENISTWYPLHDVTISNSIISEALHRSDHPKGSHSKGLLVGTSSKRVSVIRNVLAHNHERNPRINGDSSAVVINNIFYNACDHNFCSIGSGDGPVMVSIIGNSFIKGENTNTKSAIKIQKQTPPGSKVYHRNNLYDGDKVFIDATNISTSDYSPLPLNGFTVMQTSTLEKVLLSTSGARPSDRDIVDSRIVNEIKNRKGQIIDSQKEVGGWPKLAQVRQSFDIPERPHEIGDSGYTRIEELLHSLAKEIEKP